MNYYDAKDSYEAKKVAKEVSDEPGYVWSFPTMNTSGVSTYRPCRCDWFTMDDQEQDELLKLIS